MAKRLNCILLIDDDDGDNEYHRFVIDKMNITENVRVAENGIEALDFLKRENEIRPDLIFLDINMPKMNGWEFLDEYKHLNTAEKHIIIVMLTTSANPADVEKAQKIAAVKGFETKPLTPEMLTKILTEHF